jgi:hypothetical protein
MGTAHSVRHIRSDLASCLRKGLQPSIGQEFAKPIGGMGWQPLQEVFQVGEQIVLVTFAAGRIIRGEGQAARAGSLPWLDR